MKQVLFIFLVLFSFGAAAQVTTNDTTKLTSPNLSLRLNDWEFIGPRIAYSQQFENLYDSIKLRLRFGTYPTSGTGIHTVQQVTNGELVTLARIMKRARNDANATTVDRVISAIKAMNASAFHYVNRQIKAMEDAEAEEFLSNRREGKRIYRRE